MMTRHFPKATRQPRLARLQGVVLNSKDALPACAAGSFGGALLEPAVVLPRHRAA